MFMEIKDVNIQFIDSLNFMSMSLKKLPKAFGLNVQEEIDGDFQTLQKGQHYHYFYINTTNI